jgi:hypothetical protein
LLQGVQFYPLQQLPPLQQLQNMSKQRKKKEDRKAAQRASASQRDNTRVAPATPVVTRSARTFASETNNSSNNKRALTFGKDTYTWMGIGFALVIIGLLLMSGGRGDDPTVFDESVIYSFRRITLAPIVMLAGLGTVIYAILKK